VFFVCQQHAPEYFWKPEYQVHPNTAQAVEEVAMISEDPSAFAETLGKLQIPEAVSVLDGEVICETMRGRVRVMTPERHIEWYGEGRRSDAPDGPHFSAMRIAVSDIEATRECLLKNGIEFGWARAGLIVPSLSVHGCTLAFSQI